MNNFNKAKTWLENADAIIVTAGNGFSKQEGLDILSEKDFDKEFSEVAQKYNVHTVGDALDKQFGSWNEQWKFWSNLVNKYSLNYHPSDTMDQLKSLLKGKEYFIATSSFGHFFEKANFDKKRIFNIFGDWTQMQCSSGLNHGQRSAIKEIKKIISAEEQGKEINDEFVPKCEDCNSPMELYMPLNSHFFPDENANTRFRWFLTNNENKNVVVLELGVDMTSPQLLDPIAALVMQFENWNYVAADLATEDIPDELKEKTVTFNANSHELIKKLCK
ncbi:Sir2 family NAD-dependent protein deacetylase [Lactobacillus sp. LL6]|uniref:Sir2 family NAD-dependent protein deacetylase n=1 Tax=Lactobacillus sp. LL6 TaxID=2596827 RepID=UPI0011865351|nr:Sir2 family NAD-dependent protein deacetylase [Lactobacillus sp. LL6]TSO26824.1 Sir2 family NAD-dependent protein deacetylase [Lactobacillus sp. LL6]